MASGCGRMEGTRPAAAGFHHLEAPAFRPGSLIARLAVAFRPLPLIIRAAVITTTSSGLKPALAEQMSLPAINGGVS